MIDMAVMAGGMSENNLVAVPVCVQAGKEPGRRHQATQDEQGKEGEEGEWYVSTPVYHSLAFSMACGNNLLSCKTEYRQTDSAWQAVLFACSFYLKSLLSASQKKTLISLTVASEKQA